MQYSILFNSLENGLISEGRSSEPDVMAGSYAGLLAGHRTPRWGKGVTMTHLKVIVAAGGGEVNGC